MIEVSQELSRKMANMAFFCAMLVMLIHYPEGEWHGDMISVFLWQCFPGAVLRVAVPFFFCAAGFWLAGKFGGKGWWKRAVVSRMKSLLIPYFLLNSIWFVWMLAYDGAACPAEPAGWVHKVLIALGFVRGEYPALPHLWFVWRLFLLVLVSPVCWAIIKRGRLLAYIVAMSIYVLLAGRALYIDYGGVGVPAVMMPFKYIVPPVGFAGFMIGATMRVYGVPQIKRGGGAFLGALGFVVLFLSHTVVNGGVAKIVLFYAGMPVFLLGAWVCMPAISVPSWIVRNTFAIYIFHWMLFWFVDKIFVACGCRGVLNSVWCLLLLLFVAIVLSCSLAELLKKQKTLGMLILGGR